LNILSKKSRMLKVAITGGIGSGKSLVCSIFEKLNVPIFYADPEAKELMNTDIGIREKMLNSFGFDIFDDNFQLNRSKLAAIIFNNKDALSTINSIVHPVVRKEFNSWAGQQHSPYVILESAIILESELVNDFDKIITVSAPLEVRIERVMKRDHVDREAVIERIKNQMDEDLRCEKSDYIIVNDGKEIMVLPQIINIHNSLH